MPETMVTMDNVAILDAVIKAHQDCVGHWEGNGEWSFPCAGRVTSHDGERAAHRRHVADALDAEGFRKLPRGGQYHQGDHCGPACRGWNCDVAKAREEERRSRTYPDGHTHAAHVPCSVHCPKFHAEPGICGAMDEEYASCRLPLNHDGKCRPDPDRL